MAHVCLCFWLCFALVSCVRTRSGTSTEPNLSQENRELREQLELLKEEIQQLRQPKTSSEATGSKWFRWAWSLVTRTKVPPLEFPEDDQDEVVPEEDAGMDEAETSCDGVLSCSASLCSQIWRTCRFFFAQIWILMTRPTFWVSQLNQSCVELVSVWKQDAAQVVGLMLAIAFIAYLVNAIASLTLMIWEKRLGSVFQRFSKKLSFLVLILKFKNLLARVARSHHQVENEVKRRVQEELAKGGQAHAVAAVNHDANQRAVPRNSTMLCFKCGKPGHISRNCPTWRNKFQAQVEAPRAQEQFVMPAPRQRRDQPVQVQSDVAISPEVVRASQLKLPTQTQVGTVNNVEQEETGTQLKAPAFLGPKGVKCVLIIDTGSSVNVMPEVRVKKMGLSVNADLAPGQTHLRAFNGGIARVLGVLNLRVKLGAWEVEIPFYVARGVSHVILGVPGLSAMAVTIDPANGRLVKGADALLCDGYQDHPPACRLVEVAGYDMRDAQPSSSHPNASQ